MNTKSWLVCLTALMGFLGVLPAKADSSLMLSETSTTTQIASRNHWLRPFFGLRNALMYRFDVSSPDEPRKMTQVKLRIPDSARLPDGLYLLDGDTQLAVFGSPDSSTRIATLEGFVLDIPAGTTKTLTIKADFFGGADTGTYGQVGVVSATYTTAANAVATATPAARLVSKEQRIFRPMSANVRVAETPTAVEERDQATGELTSVYGHYVIEFAPEGGDLSMPTADDFVVIGRIGRDEVPCTVSILGGAISQINNGTTYNVEIAARIPMTIPGTYQRSGAVSFRLCQVTWRNFASSPSITVPQTWGLANVNTLVTASLPKGDPETLVTTARMPKVTPKLYDEITAAQQPDSDGFMPQLKSEGGVFMIDASPNRQKTLVFPAFVPVGQDTRIIGQLAMVDLVVNSSTMTPSFRAPANLSADSRDNLIDYPVQNISRIPTTGQDTVANFEVVLGTLRVQGRALRKSASTAVMQFYWDCEIGQTSSAGQFLDCLDISAADAIGNAPGRPMRFSVGIGQVSKDASSFRLNVTGAPGAFLVQTSRDLMSWSPVSFEYGPMQSAGIDEYTMAGEISVPTSALTTPEASARYFRLMVP